jgi:hypothetical protein
LEGKFADKKLGRLLILSDFTKGDGTRAETMRLLDTTGSGLYITHANDVNPSQGMHKH